MSARTKIGASLALLLLVGSTPSCRRRSESDAIAAMVADMAACAEKRDAEGLIARLAPEYRDFNGRDRDQTATLVNDYFSRYRGIVIHILASRIVVEGPGRAALTTEVSLSSGLAQAFRKLIRFSGENYRFSCRLRKEKRWLITEAGWESVALDGLFPESLKILRELFPDL